MGSSTPKHMCCLQEPCSQVDVFLEGAGGESNFTDSCKGSENLWEFTVRLPSSSQDAEGMQGWVAWDNYQVCNFTTGTVPVLLLGDCNQPAVCLTASSLEWWYPAPFQGLIWGCAHRQVPWEYQGGTEVRGKLLAHWEQTPSEAVEGSLYFLHEYSWCQKTAFYLCLLYPPPMQSKWSFVIHFHLPASFLFLEAPLYTEDMGAYSWKQPAQKLGSI